MNEWSNHTINTLTKTGTSDATYGTEYYVKFNGQNDTFKLWFQKEPEVGTEIEGKIYQGDYGMRFKKKPRDPNATPSRTPMKASPKKNPFTPGVNREDGMKQGMCVNNAANYVLKVTELNGIELDPEEWAKKVNQYANALYAKSELSLDPVAAEEVNTVNSLFGA